MIALPRVTPYRLAIDGGARRVFVFSAMPGDRGAVTTIDADTERVLRTVPIYDEPAAVAIAADRLLVAGKSHSGMTSRLYLFDAHTGALAHTSRLDLDAAGLAVDHTLGRVFALTQYSGSLVMLDAHTGAPVRTIHLGFGNGSEASLAVDERSGLVFANAPAGFVSVLDARTGALLRRLPVNAQAQTIRLDPSLGRAVVTNLDNSRAQLLDTRRGTLIGSIDAGSGSVGFDPVSGRIFGNDIGGVPNTLRVLDARTGALLHALHAGSDVEEVLATAQGGRAFVRGGDSMVVMDSRSGNVLRATPLDGTDGSVITSGSAGVMAEAVRLGRVLTVGLGPTVSHGLYAGSYIGRGDLSVFDARTGGLLRTIPTGVCPEAVSADERTGHAFVVDSGGKAPGTQDVRTARGAVYVIDIARV